MMLLVTVDIRDKSLNTLFKTTTTTSSVAIDVGVDTTSRHALLLAFFRIEDHTMINSCEAKFSRFNFIVLKTFFILNFGNR